MLLSIVGFVGCVVNLEATQRICETAKYEPAGREGLVCGSAREI